ncbi:MAG: ATP-binding cassette domain-containing protein [Candidatus Helarchaeota archaeon]
MNNTEEKEKEMDKTIQNDKNIIDVKNLTKTFESGSMKVEAVKGISFTVKEGEIFGFLGPNGAGKTTTLNMLSTLLFPTSGTATIAGNDINKDPDKVRKSIGMVFQDMSLDIDLTGFENLDLHATMYGVDKKIAKERIDEMLKIVDLKDKEKEFVKNYSGGMKRRLEIARGLLHYPRCLFLDEPTIGLDPQTRRSIWNHIKRLNKEYHITIILTTHYMDEADELCDRICIIDHGKIIALGTSDELKKELKGDIISLEFENPKSLKAYKRLIKDLPAINEIKIIAPKNFQPSPMMPGMMPGMASQMPAKMREMMMKKQGMTPKKMKEMKQKMAAKNATQMNISIDNASEKVPELIKIANESSIKIKSLTIKQPSLEDVFISYTGRTIREQGGEGKMAMMRQLMQKRMMRGPN